MLITYALEDHDPKWVLALDRQTVCRRRLERCPMSNIATERTLPGPGRVGVWTKADSVIWFENINIKSLD
jgi:hypothetical protein